MEFTEILKWAHDQCAAHSHRNDARELALLLTLYNTARIVGTSQGKGGNRA